MESAYQTVVAERFQRITSVQGAAWLNAGVLKISHVLVLFQEIPQQRLNCHFAGNKAQFLFL